MGGQRGNFYSGDKDHVQLCGVSFALPQTLNSGFVPAMVQSDIYRAVERRRAVCGVIPIFDLVKQWLFVKTFETLFVELQDRAANRPEGSGTVAALDAGVHAQGKKVLEEAGEVWIAAEHEGDDSLAEEISQLLYWVQVLMVGRGLKLEDVYRHL